MTSGKINQTNEYESNLTDYNTYKLSAVEKAIYIFAAAVVVFVVAYVFYRSLYFSLLLCPLSLLYPRYKVKEIVEKRKIQLNIQFKDMLYSLSSSLSAGKSVEMAFKDISSDLEVLYPDVNRSIVREINIINRRIDMNETIETALSDFAKRSHLEDVHNFVDVFQTCKRTGGNIVEVIKNASTVINDKIEIKQEIDTMMAERKFERKILNVLPVLLVILLSMGAGDYIKPVFETLEGRIAMTLSLGLFALSFAVSGKIMNIKV